MNALLSARLPNFVPNKWILCILPDKLEFWRILVKMTTRTTLSTKTNTADSFWGVSKSNAHWFLVFWMRPPP